MDKIEKNYGRGAIMKMGDDQVEEIAVIPTGSIGLNAALGVGGYPEVVSSRYMAPNLQVKPHSPFTPLPRRKRPVV